MTQEQLDIILKMYNAIFDAKDSLSKGAEQYLKESKNPNASLYYAPFQSYKLDEYIRVVQEYMVRYVRNYVLKGKPNIKIDDSDVSMIVFGERSFSHKVGYHRIDWLEVIAELNQQYADVDAVAHKQIYDQVKRGFIPVVWDDNHNLESLEQTQRSKFQINPKTNELTFDVSYRSESLQALLKFIAIRLKNISPSRAQGKNIVVGEGYSDELIKSLKLYKNGNAKLRFHNKNDAYRLIDELLSNLRSNYIMVVIDTDKYNVYSLIDQGSFIGVFMTTIKKDIVKQLYRNYVEMCRSKHISHSPSKFADYINNENIMNRKIYYIAPDYLHINEGTKNQTFIYKYIDIPIYGYS